MCIKDANINTNKQAKHVNDKKVYSKRKIVLITWVKESHNRQKQL